MVNENDPNSEEESNAPAWQILERNQRRVFGVLIEKAKTTPENYPLSLNALRNGCNQKSNRFPQLQLTDDDVEDTLEELRKLGAIGIIEGGGRVDKYRHRAYDWLGVDKYELAVMAEILLRGVQTMGELRSRAARMESIPGMTELKPIVEQLVSRGLMLRLTPPGRGCMVTHALYEDAELERVRAEHGTYTEENVPRTQTPQSENHSPEPLVSSTPSPVASTSNKPSTPTPERQASQPAADPQFQALQETTNRLEQRCADMEREIAELRTTLATTTDQLRHDLDDLCRQLGN